MQPSLFDEAPDASPNATTSTSPNTTPKRESVPDQADRDFAVDPGHHVVLEASAGTGKTRVLVDRYVQLIASGADPHNILAITFTRKAAAEMRQRVLDAIDHRVAFEAAFAARWQPLRARVAEVNISTIDAFCFGLLREFPLEADVDPAFEIADETEVPRFINEAIELALRDCRGLIVSDENVRLLFARVKQRDLRRALEHLIASRHVAVQAVGRFVRERVRYATVDDVCRQFVERLGRELDRSGQRDAILDDGPMASPEFAWLARDLTALSAFPTSDHAAVRRLRRRVGEYFGRDGEPRKQAANRFNPHFPSAEKKKRHNAAIRQLAPAVVREAELFDIEINGLLARGLERVLLVAVARYESLLASHSVLDFEAMLSKAVQLLSKREEFARSRLKLQSRYHHLLVDEFQDTSRLQWDLVQCLTAAWREGESAEDTNPSIFIVGDRKQSIYRFRHAEVTLLDEAAEFIDSLREGPTVRRAIQHSFRAVPELLSFVNALSSEITSGVGIPDEFRYRDTDRFPVAHVSPGARRDGSPVLGLAVGASVEASADAVASEIERLLAERVIVRDRAGSREIQRDDIAILFRSRAGHRVFEQALEARGIKTYVYKGLGFFDAPEVQDVQALIRYLAAPESNLRAAEFLRSRFVRLSDVSLTRLAPNIAASLRAQTLDVDATGLDANDRALFIQARASVATWLQLVDRLPPGDVIDRVLDESAYVFEMRGRRLSQARENVKKVRNLVRRVQNHGYATMARLADYFRTLSAGDESNAIVAGKGAVQLMTIHEAKGLEFPVVFLVRMNAGVGGGGSSITVVPKDADGEPDVTIAIGSDAKKLEGKRDAEEARRLLYVAATRARDRLYFAAEVQDGRLDRRGKSSLVSLLPHSLRSLFERTATFAGPEIEWSAASGETFAFRVCQPVPAPAVADDVVVSGAPVDLAPLGSAGTARVAATSVGRAVADADEWSVTAPGAKTDQLVGTLTHRLFQRQPKVAGLDELAGVARTLLTSEELAGAEPGVVERAVQAFVAIRQRPEVAELLASGECLFEVPFSYRAEAAEAGGDIVRGTVDCLVIQPSGHAVVVEFKTGRRRPEHERQLEVYAAAIQAAWPGRAIATRLIYADPD